MTFWSALPPRHGIGTTGARCPVPRCWQYCPSAPTAPYSYCPVREGALRPTPEKAGEPSSRCAKD